MKFSILALASATAVSAAPAPPALGLDVVFQARNFSASCVPHSAMCSYSLNAFQPGTMDTLGYNCTASGVAGWDNGPALPEIQGGTCLPSSRTFDVVRTKKGLEVIVSVQVSPISYTRGSHLIPNRQIKMIKGVTPTGNYQAYVGPKDFDLKRVDY
ncbi:hypothetical protein V8F06_009321 [Rhypophila decipiens]